MSDDKKDKKRGSYDSYKPHRMYRVPEELALMLEKEAKELGIPTTQFVVMMIVEGLKQRQAQQLAKFTRLSLTD